MPEIVRPFRGLHITHEATAGVSRLLGLGRCLGTRFIIIAESVVKILSFVAGRILSILNMFLWYINLKHHDV